MLCASSVRAGRESLRGCDFRLRQGRHVDDRLIRWAGGAADSSVVVALQREWQQLAVSARLRARLRRWARDEAALDFVDGHELVAATSDRPAGPDRTCGVLAGLVGRVPGDQLALRVAVQVMLARWCAIIDCIGGLELDERAALVVEAGTYQIVACDPEAAATPIDVRLWANTRRQAIRAAERARGRPEQPTCASELERHAGPVADQPATDGELERLTKWVADRGKLAEEVARLIVGTRATGARLQEIAEASGQPAGRLRQRRHRGERRFRRRLAAVA